MQSGHTGLTVRRVLLLLALAAAVFGLVDSARERRLVDRYRRKAEFYDAMVRQCRRIGAMDDAARQNEAGGVSDPYLDNPEWTRRMISYYEFLKRKYEHAAANPRELLLPDPDHPN